MRPCAWRRRAARRSPRVAAAGGERGGRCGVGRESVGGNPSAGGCTRLCTRRAKQGQPFARMWPGSRAKLESHVCVGPSSPPTFARVWPGQSIDAGNQTSYKLHPQVRANLIQGTKHTLYNGLESFALKYSMHRSIIA